MVEISFALPYKYQPDPVARTAVQPVANRRHARKGGNRDLPIVYVERTHQSNKPMERPFPSKRVQY